MLHFSLEFHVVQLKFKYLELFEVWTKKRNEILKSGKPGITNIIGHYNVRKSIGISNIYSQIKIIKVFYHDTISLIHLNLRCNNPSYEDGYPAENEQQDCAVNGGN